MEANTENDFGKNHVPTQQTGSEMDAVETTELGSEEEAIIFFKVVKERLLDVNRWAEIAGIPMSSFTLTDLSGNEVKRKAKEGDYIRIDVPGPGTQTGDGFDWVVIERIAEEVLKGAEVLSITVRPAANPSNNDDNTAHFLSEEATSTFQVKRIENTVYAEEHGRNEVPNTGTEQTMDNIRNTFVGWAAKLGFSYPQWKALVAGLLDKTNNQ